MVELQRRYGWRWPWCQDAVDGEEWRRRTVKQRPRAGRAARAPQEQRRGEQRGRVTLPAARTAHILALRARALRHAAWSPSIDRQTDRPIDR